MDTINDVHLQFASYFRSREIAPYLYLLSQKMEEGSICLNLDTWKEEIKEGFPFVTENVSKEMLTDNKLVGNSLTVDRPFILDKNRLYFQRYFQYEIQLIQQIKAMVEAESPTGKLEELTSLKADFERLFPNEKENNDWQKIAAFFALTNNFTIITGGPGTGKTTTVSKILELCLLLNPNATLALAAPTGKAAARMAESLRNVASGLSETTKQRFSELKPSTIHRLLGTIKDSIYFRHNASNPLPYDIIVIDECSMIDIALFSKLLNAVTQNTKLILLGDKDQLSSVEVGSLFGDLCKTVNSLDQFSEEKIALVRLFFPEQKLVASKENAFLQDNIIELTESRRFDSQKGIGRFANAVIHHIPETLDAMMETQADSEISFDFLRSEQVWKDFAKKYRAYIDEQDILKALMLLDDQRILCVVREGDQGTRKFNQKIEDYLSASGILTINDSFYENRPIMVMENNYELGLFNGDIGILRRDGDVMKAWFMDSENIETGLKSVLPGLISRIETVFAMTIHKSQGSEFSHVMIVLPDSHQSTQIMTREILYTAITRAKESVLISASATTIRETSERQVKRNSGVAVRL